MLIAAAGTKEDPSYHVHAGSAYTTTQGLEDKSRRELGYAGGSGGGGPPPVYNEGAIVTTTAGMDQKDLLDTFGAKAQVGVEFYRMIRICPAGRRPSHPFSSARLSLTPPFSRPFSAAQVGADAAARPWESVGGVGFDAKPKARAPVYVPPTTRDDLNEKSPEAVAVAEEFNERAVKAFKKKEWQLVYDLASEAIRLNPRKASVTTASPPCNHRVATA